MKTTLIASIIVASTLFALSGCWLFDMIFPTSSTVDLRISIIFVNARKDVLISVDNESARSVVDAKYRIVFSSDTTISFGDPEVYAGFVSVGAGMGTNVQISISDFDLSGISAGSYYIGVIVDPNNELQAASTRKRARTTETYTHGPGALPGVNQPPSAPSGPAPSNNAAGVSVELGLLSWTASTDPDGDPVSYSVYFGAGNVPHTPNEVGLSTAQWSPGPLAYATTYKWQVVANDGQGGVTEAPVWTFTTEAASPDPDAVTIEVQYAGSDAVNAASPLVVAMLDPTRWDKSQSRPWSGAFRLMDTAPTTVTILESDMPTTSEEGYLIVIIHDLNGNFGAIVEPDAGDLPGWYSLGAEGNLLYSDSAPSMNYLTFVYPGDSISVNFNPPESGSGIGITIQ